MDIGNSLVKLAAFDGGRLIAQTSTRYLQPSVFEEILPGHRAERAIVESTRGDADEILSQVHEHADYVLEFTPQTPVPIANAYRTPETLGRDRLAAAVGATVLYPGRNVLIVDFGTAVTIDLVTADATSAAGVFRRACGPVSGRCTTIRPSCLSGRRPERGVAGPLHRGGHPFGRDELADLRNRGLYAAHE